MRWWIENRNRGDIKTLSTDLSRDGLQNNPYPTSLPGITGEHHCSRSSGPSFLHHEPPDSTGSYQRRYNTASTLADRFLCQKILIHAYWPANRPFDPKLTHSSNHTPLRTMKDPHRQNHHWAETSHEQYRTSSTQITPPSLNLVEQSPHTQNADPITHPPRRSTHLNLSLAIISDTRGLAVALSGIFTNFQDSRDTLRSYT